MIRADISVEDEATVSAMRLAGLPTTPDDGQSDNFDAFKEHIEVSTVGAKIPSNGLSRNWILETIPMALPISYTL